MAGPLERLGARLLARVPASWLPQTSGSGESVRGRRLDPHLALVARVAGRQAPLHSMTPAEARASLDSALESSALPLRPLEERRFLRVPGAEGELDARVYVPLGLEGPRPLLLYFHQGGCVIGNLDWCEYFCSLLAETARCIVLSVDYRKGPEHRFPAAQEDAWSVYTWALEHAGEIGGDPKRVAVGGDSAGGGLSAQVCQRAVEAGLRAPVLQLLVYPWLVAFADNDSYRDFGDAYPLSPAGMRWFLDHYASAADEDDPRLSPGNREDLAGLPTALVYTAGFDVLSDEGEDYAARLENAGVATTFRCYESLCHSFTSLAGASPAAAQALEEIARDVEGVLSRELGD